MNKIEMADLLSSNVKHIRKELNLSQNQFAVSVGIKRQNLATLEEKRAMSIETVYAISRFIKVSIDTLLTTEMAPKEGIECNIGGGIKMYIKPPVETKRPAQRAGLPTFKNQ